MNAVNIKISVQLNVNKSSIIGFFLAYGNIFIVTAEVNGSTGFNFSRVGDFFPGGKIPACIFSCSLQLRYVYCIGICFAFCYIDNLTISVFAAYGYCISSVSYTAGTQSNSAFRRYRSTVADSNRLLNCRCTFTNFNLGIIRCRISSHRRSHACTGHYTCSNQHCQQLFGRAAFTAMIFCNFGDNNICVARLTPNYFKYFVHQKFLPHK